MSAERDKDINLTNGRIYTKDEFLFRIDSIRARRADAEHFIPLIEQVEAMSDGTYVFFEESGSNSLPFVTETIPIINSNKDLQ